MLLQSERLTPFCFSHFCPPQLHRRHWRLMMLFYQKMTLAALPKQDTKELHVHYTVSYQSYFLFCFYAWKINGIFTKDR